MNKTLGATLCGLLGYSIYGFSFIFAKVALDVADPDIFLALRFTLAFAVLCIFLLSGKVKMNFKGKPVGKLLLMGFIQPVLYFICEAYGIAMTSASFSGVIIGLVPVAGLIFGMLFLKEKCSAIQIILTVLSVVGVALTTTGGIGEISLVGFLLLIISVISTTIFSVLSRSIADDFSPFERTFAMTGLGSISFVIIALFKTKVDFSLWIQPFENFGFVISLLYLALISSVGAFMLINYALNYLNVGHTLIFSNFTTVISVFAGILILGDTFTSVQLIGVGIIILSVFGVSVCKLKTNSNLWG